MSIDFELVKYVLLKQKERFWDFRLFEFIVEYNKSFMIRVCFMFGLVGWRKFLRGYLYYK